MPTILFTGASRGLGAVAARRMLDDDPGLRLIVLTRDGRTDLPRTTAIKADLASMEAVRRAAGQITEPLDGFVGNAGVQMPTTRTATPDGYETTFAVNVLANYLLLRLLPFKSRGRIVITGSDSHFGTFRHTFGLVPAPTWTDPERLARPGTVRRGRGAYSTSKLGVLYLVHELARRLPEGLDAYTFNPGFTPGTGLVRYDRAGDVLWRRFLPLMPGVNTVERAGHQLAKAATGPRPGPSGAYIDRWEVVPSSDESYDEAREKELYEAAAKLTAS
ncbi:SDR family NAD(P)-dependent oxidoreductase [Paractinoplanes globisporus]|uniref:SDR family NAD(P)-dependent oxidoreductase n=1 Tax=Paractinoplanes globisporus TaxID=113565 RepID=A0ABW6WB35_9ACTN|nr:SDR family NAD(P)-dependent oxidoreductase [Actinoplanes globisporus]